MQASSTIVRDKARELKVKKRHLNETEVFAYMQVNAGLLASRVSEAMSSNS